jgi:hypothetical protein
MIADDLFNRHLDLAPLGRRRRGLVRCIFHEERTASLSIDLDRGLFHCFGCGVAGGRRRFAERVGELAPVALRRECYVAPLEDARAEVLLGARRQPWASMLHEYAMADMVRYGRRRVTELRAEGHAVGDWNSLAAAAHVETAVNALEHSLDTPPR